MANPSYVRSTDGNNADDGSTWLLADEDHSGFIATAVAGDRAWVSDNHNHTYTADTILTFPGTPSSPNEILGGDDAAEPPTSLSATPTINTNAGSDLTLNGSFYCRGHVFNIGSGSTIAVLKMVNTATPATQVYDTCVFNMVGTNSNNDIALGMLNNSENATIRWKGCDVQFSHVSANIHINSADLHWDGGSFLTDTNPTYLVEFNTASRSRKVLIENTDLSLMTSGSLVSLTNMRSGDEVIFRNCKINSGVSRTSGTFANNGAIIIFDNCTSTGDTYKTFTTTYGGTVQDETVVVRTGGASDGTTPYSLKMNSNGSCNEFVSPLKTTIIPFWNDTVGSAITPRIEFVHDSVGAGAGSDIQDDQLKVTFKYLGTSGSSQGNTVSSGRVNILSSLVDYTNSSETWTTTGLTTPVKQYAEESFTPQEKGYVLVEIELLDPSLEVFVCPEIANL